MSGFFDPPPVVDECIYCRATGVPLQDEHIIPYGLNGTWQLLAASCEPCARITSAFERAVLRESFLAARASLGFRTYHPKRRPKVLPLEVERGRGPEILHLPIEEHPAILGLPRFPLPSWLLNRSSCVGIANTGVRPVHLGRMDPISFTRKYADPGLKVTVPVVDANAFARMVAKIAYSYCIGVFGFEAIAENYVLPAIRGLTDDVGTWVGSTAEEFLELSPTPDARVTHLMGTDVYQGDILIYLRLFAWAVPTEYVVVVGRASESHVDDQAHGRTFRGADA